MTWGSDLEEGAVTEGPQWGQKADRLTLHANASEHGGKRGKDELNEKQAWHRAQAEAGGSVWLPWRTDGIVA
jgi:hypothetical protein